MGSFREKNGKLEYRFSFKDPYGKVIRKSVTGYSEEECLSKYEAYMKSIASPITEKSDGTTIPMLLKEVLNNDFNKNYIHTEIFPRELGRKIVKAEEIRHASDYDTFYIASKEVTEQQIETAEKILSLAEAYLIGKE